MVADFASRISRGEVRVLLQHRQLVGYVVSFPLSDSCAVPHQDSSHSGAPSPVYFLENIAVLPDRQGAGYGRLMINEVIAGARKNNSDCIELYTNEMMVENIMWYRKLGFEEFDRRVEDGFNRVYLRLQLL